MDGLSPVAARGQPVAQNPASPGFEAALAQVAQTGGTDRRQDALALAIEIGRDPVQLDRLRNPGSQITKGGYCFKLAPDGMAADGRANAFRIDISGANMTPLRYTLPNAPLARSPAVMMWHPDASDAEGSRLYDQLQADPVLGEAFSSLCITGPQVLTQEKADGMGELAEAAAGWSRDLKAMRVRELFAGAPVSALVNDRPIAEIQGSPMVSFGAQGAQVRIGTSAAAQAMLLDPSVTSMRVGIGYVADGERYPQPVYEMNPPRELLIARDPANGNAYSVREQSRTDAFETMFAGYHYREPNSTTWRYVRPNSPAVPLPAGTLIRMPDTGYDDRHTAEYRQMMATNLWDRMRQWAGGSSELTPRYIEVRLPRNEELSAPDPAALAGQERTPRGGDSPYYRLLERMEQESAQRAEANRIEELAEFTSDRNLGAEFAVAYEAVRPDLTMNLRSSLAELGFAAGDWSTPLKQLKVDRLVSGEAVESLVRDRPIEEFSEDGSTGLADTAARAQAIAAAAASLLRNPEITVLRVATDGGLTIVADGERYARADFLPDAAQDLTITRDADAPGQFIIRRAGENATSMPAGGVVRLSGTGLPVSQIRLPLPDDMDPQTPDTDQDRSDRIAQLYAHPIVGEVAADITGRQRTRDMTAQAMRDIIRLAEARPDWSPKLLDAKIDQYFKGSSVSSLMSDRSITEISLDDDLPAEERAANMAALLGAINRMLTDPGISCVRIHTDNKDKFTVMDGGRFPSSEYYPIAKQDLFIQRVGMADDYMAGNVGELAIFHKHQAPGAPVTSFGDNQFVGLPGGTRITLAGPGLGDTVIGQFTLPEVDNFGNPMPPATPRSGSDPDIQASAPVRITSITTAPPITSIARAAAEATAEAAAVPVAEPTDPRIAALVFGLSIGRNPLQMAEIAAARSEGRPWSAGSAEAGFNARLSPDGFNLLIAGPGVPNLRVRLPDAP